MLFSDQCFDLPRCIFKFSDKFCIYRLPLNPTFSAHHVFFAVIVLNRMKNSKHVGLPYVIITIFLLLSIEMKCEDMNSS
jgi:hypothetical protein